MYKFLYKGSDELRFDNPKQAVDYFNSKGYGMSNWNIYFNEKEITLDRFNFELDTMNDIPLHMLPSIRKSNPSIKSIQPEFRPEDL